MAYSLSGEFYEACDCEVVCSCWTGVAPDMGVCTGLYAWHITAGTVDGLDVAGCIAMLIFNGTTCDSVRHVMLLVHGSTKAKRDALDAAIRIGPWADVVRLDQPPAAVPPHPTVTMLPAIHATITVIPLVGSNVAISATATDIVAEATCHFDGFTLQGGPANNLIQRSVGGNAPVAISAGKVFTNANGSGLNLLATTIPVDASEQPYTFDLDITDVSAVRGNFSYVWP